MTTPFTNYIQGLTAATFVNTTDTIYVLQGGVSKQATIATLLSQGRMNVDVAITSNTSLANLSGMSVTLQPSRVYDITAAVFIKSGASAGGVQAALNGTAGFSDLIYDGYSLDTGSSNIHGYVLASAFGTAVGNGKLQSDQTSVYLHGTIAVTTGGTLTVQGAQSLSSGTATIFGRGSFIWVRDVT